MDRVALDLGIIQIYWYSLFIFLGILFGSLMIVSEAKKRKLNQDFIINLIFYGIIYGIIGARLYYVLFNKDYYLSNPLEIFEIWNGGLAIHGGILLGLTAVIIYARKYKVKLLKLLDIIVVGLILGQAIGRWGNFFNGEAYGSITTLTHLQNLHLPDFIIKGMFIEGAYRIPTFFYESIWCLIGFVALLVIRKYKYLKRGWLTSIYLIWYSLGRIFIEGMRADSLMLGNIKMAQLVSIIGIVVGILLFISCNRGAKFDNLYREEEKEITF